MFAKHPLEAVIERIREGRIADALRLAIIAELDALSTYLQIASAAEDPDVRRVFESVAEEEKEHVGEFLELLYRYDPGLAERIAAGAREVEELTGKPSLLTQRKPGSSSSRQTVAGGGGATGNPEEPVAKLFLEELRARRLLADRLPRTVLPESADYAVAIRVSGDSAREELVALKQLQVEFTIPLTAVERAKATGEPVAAPIVAAAASRLAVLEERAVLEALEAVEGEAAAVEAGDWGEPGRAVEQVAEAVAAVEAEGGKPPYLLVLPPRAYVALLAYSGRSGQSELDRVSRLATPLRHSLLSGDKGYLVPLDPSVADIVTAGDVRVTELGLEPEGYRFLAREKTGVRVQRPQAIAVLKLG